MKCKKLLAVFLSLALMVCMVPYASANDISDDYDLEMSDIYAVALHAPAHFLPTADWASVTITKTTPLYNLNNEVTAYCIDLKNMDTNENAYVIVNGNRAGAPILQYAPAATSPYFEISSDQQAIFLAATAYYVLDGEDVVNLTSGESIKKSVLSANCALMSAEVSDNLVSESFSSEWENYISDIMPRAYDTKEVVLSGVPNWQWQKGCAPTAIGMQLAKLYPSLANESVISELATALHTTSPGVTPRSTIPEYTKSFIVSKGLGTPSFCDYPSRNSDGTPKVGSAYNTYSSYRAEIDAGRAVSIYSIDATISTPGYPNGWPAHMITGLGYSYEVRGTSQYVIVHTTCVAGGNVYINISSALGQYAWFFVQK